MKYFILITITLILNMGTAMTENAYEHSFKSINEEERHYRAADCRLSRTGGAG